jgi:hypothetical protein
MAATMSERLVLIMGVVVAMHIKSFFSFATSDCSIPNPTYQRLCRNRELPEYRRLGASSWAIHIRLGGMIVLVLHAPFGRLSCIEQLGCILIAGSSDKSLPGADTDLHPKAAPESAQTNALPQTLFDTERLRYVRPGQCGVSSMHLAGDSGANNEGEAQLGAGPPLPVEWTLPRGAQGTEGLRFLQHHSGSPSHLLYRCGSRRRCLSRCRSDQTS